MANLEEALGSGRAAQQPSRAVHEHVDTMCRRDSEVAPTKPPSDHALAEASGSGAPPASRVAAEVASILHLALPLTVSNILNFSPRLVLLDERRLELRALLLDAIRPARRHFALSVLKV